MQINKNASFNLLQYSMRSWIFLIFCVRNVFPYLKEPRPDEGAELEDRYLHALDIVRKYGYPAENHKVTTEDGYVLNIHRIPYGRLCPQNETKGPLLLQHGLFCSSMEFLVTGTKRALAYVLADSCYDVWIPNHRGNTYSREHVSVDVHSPAYWNFSWHELAIYDVPASIDYILNYTNHKDLVFMGHSQGGTVFLVFGALRPEYTEKVKVGFLLAPIAFWVHAKSKLMKAIASIDEVFFRFLRGFGINYFLLHTRLLTEAGGVLCTASRQNRPSLCEHILFALAGWDFDQFNHSLFPIVTGHTPAGASIKQVLHYTQGLKKDNFAYFDYGTVKNMKMYNQKEPPNYDLSQIKIPTLIFHSWNDWLAQPEDIDMLYERLNCTKKKYLVPYKKFNHVDFLYSKDVLHLFYDWLVEILDKYNAT